MSEKVHFFQGILITPKFQPNFRLGLLLGAAELGIQGIQLHTLILEVQSKDTLENRDASIFS